MLFSAVSIFNTFYPVLVCSTCSQVCTFTFLTAIGFHRGMLKHKCIVCTEFERISDIFCYDDSIKRKELKIEGVCIMIWLNFDIS